MKDVFIFILFILCELVVFSLIFYAISNFRKTIVPKGYNSIKRAPPDEELEVIDEFGSLFIENPCYYPFKVVPKAPYTKWTSEVVSCKPYWDGSWLISVSLSNSTEVGTIIGWRKKQK